ncbi:MAG: DUF4105 domain-containing protein [Bacteroidota bacterium]
MKLRLGILLLLGTFSCSLFAKKTLPEKLSPSATISLLTVAPGAELYSAFGHTGIWVYDPGTKVSQVYNYGTFDFQPGKEMEFYVNFIKGRLIYRLETETFRRFEYVYHYFKRSYFSQTFDLTPSQVQRIYNFLRHNYQPEFRNYLYDFTYDNCATRVYDMLDYVLKDSMVWDKADEKFELSFREQLQDPYLVGREWTAFGIDLILGSVNDAHPTNKQASFLPDYLAVYFDKAQIRGKDGQLRPLVKKRNDIYEGQPPIEPSPWFVQPLLITSLLMILIGMLTVWQGHQVKSGFWFERILYFLTGIAGLILFLAWFATEHTSTAWNYNILWLFFPHVVMAWFIKRKPAPWVGQYFLVSAGLIVWALFAWLVGLQDMNVAFLPLMIILFTRSLYIYGRSQ